MAAEQFSPFPESQVLFLPNYRAYTYGAVGAIASIDIAHRLAWRLKSYFYQPYERIKSNDSYTPYFEPAFSSRFFLTSSAFIYETRIGPASLSLNYYNGSSEPWSFIFVLDM